MEMGRLKKGGLDAILVREFVKIPHWVGVFVRSKIVWVAVRSDRPVTFGFEFMQDVVVILCKLGRHLVRIRPG